MHEIRTNGPQTNLTTIPWYRQFWPWFLIALPASAVIAGIATVFIAAHKTDGLVVDDYYKEGLAINQTLKRQQRAGQLQLAASIDWDSETQVISLQLKQAQADYPQKLQLLLSHPTRAHLDSEIELSKTPKSGQYTGLLRQQPKGYWHIILQPTDKSWRLAGRAQLPEQQHWELTSQE